MKKTLKLAMIPILLLLVASPAYAGGENWFDMHNCDMCKPIMEEPDLYDHITWEQHDISNGVVAVTTVDKEFLAAYRKAHGKMEGVIGRMQKGEKVALCGSCTYIGGLMMKGIKHEAVDTAFGDVMILTSDNPEVVSEIQKWAAKNKEEMKKM
jgi:hypothetical protein